MKAIPSRDTKPELQVRRLLHKLGFRFRLHIPVLPGRLQPDIVFTAKKKVIFVHGCFWHVHQNCPGSHVPPHDFWRTKLQKNIDRDQRTQEMLSASGWKYLVVWQCELNDLTALSSRLESFLASDG